MSKRTDVEVDGISVAVAEHEAPGIDQSVLDQTMQKHVISKIAFDKKIDLTMDVARTFIEMKEFAGERPLRDSHVEGLIQHAKNGTFLIEQASLIDCICKYDGTIRRLNGHHTCWVRHFMAANWNPKIRHLRYEVETEDDFRKLYSLIDRGAPRSTSHVAQARLFESQKYHGISKTAITQAKNGLIYWLYGNSHHSNAKPKIDSIITMMETDHYQICFDVASFVNDLLASETFVKRACVMGAMFATFTKAKGDASHFWSSVRTGIGIEDAHDPRKTLRDYLQRMRVLGANAYTRTNMVPAETMFKACIYCWNAWRKHEKLRQINAPATENRPPIK